MRGKGRQEFLPSPWRSRVAVSGRRQKRNDQITEKEQEMSDTLNDTFSTFFGPTEETAGTGQVTRVIKGELTSVVVDDAERNEFLARQRVQADERNAALARLDAMMEHAE